MTRIFSNVYTNQTLVGRASVNSVGLFALSVNFLHFIEINVFLILSVAHAAPVGCCFDFIDFQIPSKRIVSALKTDSHCHNAAVVVTTRKSVFCVDPDEAWIKEVMRNMQWK
uniref:Chemokine (C-C motif) ligand 33, duplicate 2 n=1 Tax=Sinocyclocheilus grahami TaxID=75366 RepID=A0A672KX03_SINGR